MARRCFGRSSETNIRIDTRAMPVDLHRGVFYARLDMGQSAMNCASLACLHEAEHPRWQTRRLEWLI